MSGVGCPMTDEIKIKASRINRKAFIFEIHFLFNFRGQLVKEWSIFRNKLAPVFGLLSPKSKNSWSLA